MSNSVYVFVTCLNNLSSVYGVSAMINWFKLPHPCASWYLALLQKFTAAKKRQFFFIKKRPLKDRKMYVYLQEKHQNLVENILKGLNNLNNMIKPG